MLIYYSRKTKYMKYSRIFHIYCLSNIRTSCRIVFTNSVAVNKFRLHHSFSVLCVVFYERDVSVKKPIYVKGPK